MNILIVLKILIMVCELLYAFISGWELAEIGQKRHWNKFKFAIGLPLLIIFNTIIITIINFFIL
jgi:hypothetical protein